MKYPIDDDILDGRLAFVGITGSGKTTAAKGGVERLLQLQRRVCIVDLVGAWWGLRITQNARHEAFPVVIFGGSHGDLPITERSGSVIGRAVAESSESTIVTLEDLDGDAARRRFAKDFFDALHKANKHALTLVIDEADFYAPQNPVKEGPGPLLLNRIKEIASRGRQRGFRCWLISQRPQKLHKDALTQCDTLVALQLVHNRDRKAIDDWIADNANKGGGEKYIESLAALKRGEALLWSPRNDVLEYVKFPLPATFDSSATPQSDDERYEIELKPLNLTAMRGRIGKVEAEARANDPRELKKRIADLERQIAATGGIDEAEVERRVNEAGAAAAKAAIDRCVNAVKSFAVDAYLVKFEQDLIEGIEKTLGALGDELPEPPRRHNRRADLRPQPQHRFSPPKQKAGGAGGGPKPAIQKCLDAIAWWETNGKRPVQRSLAAVVAGYSPRASTFGVYISELVKDGFVETSPGAVELTDAGRAVANFPKFADQAELRDLARNLLKPQEQRVFDVVYDAYPQEIARRSVAEKIGLSPTASTCGVYISAVAAYGMVEAAGTGCIRAADWLFN